MAAIHGSQPCWFGAIASQGEKAAAIIEAGGTALRLRVKRWSRSIFGFAVVLDWIGPDGIPRTEILETHRDRDVLDEAQLRAEATIEELRPR